MKFTTYLCSSVTSVMEFSEQGLTIVYRSDSIHILLKISFSIFYFNFQMACQKVPESDFQG